LWTPEAIAMIPNRLATALLLTLAPISMPAPGSEKAKPGALVPRPELTPGEVVEIQLAALQFNDRPTKDAGITTTFRFASPGNRKVTGPLEKFTLIVKAPGYLPLINHRIAGYEPTIIRGTVAIRRVTVVAADGQAVDYEFRLSKDPESACWFTDGVIPIPREAPLNPGKIAQSSQFTPSPRLESILCLL
jgi:hypothetical protein